MTSAASSRRSPAPPGRVGLTTPARPKGGAASRSVTIRPVEGPSNGTVPSVLVICAGQRDRLNLADERILERFALRFAGQPIGPGFDARTFVDQMVRFGPAADGIFGSNDATGHLATILADAARPARPGPRGVHALPRQARLPPHPGRGRARGDAGLRRRSTSTIPAAEPPLPFPFFLKPVAAHLSQLAYRGGTRPSSPPRGRARVEIDAITAYDRALEGRSFRTLIAEELLDGALVTFEGWMQGGRMTPIGVTDAVMHPNGISFVRFEYPSAPARGAAPRWPAWPNG